MTPAKILIVDDDPGIVRSFSSLLGDEGYRVATAMSAEEATTACRQTNYDLVLLDICLPGESGIVFLKRLRQQPWPPVVLMVSGQTDIPTALEAIKLGALDYLEKPVPAERLLVGVRSALLIAAAERRRYLVVDDIDSRSRMVAGSPPMRKLLQTVAQVAATDTTVLITGENGTGKELVAARIYLASGRRDGPFVKVNCPGIPPTLFESELFGHLKGAFTGAVRDYPGKFALADGGTIFLDEIGDLPLDCQAKLLRVLESGEIQILGSEQTRTVDARVICASNHNLADLVGEGRFRQDLYYRVSVFEITVPPLRRRRGDIPLLTGEFLKRFDPSGTTRLSAEALACLVSLDFPGNVRQLKNIIERLTILFPGRTVDAESLSDCARPGLRPAHSDQPTSLVDKVADFEKYLIQNTLADTDGNISEAARLLKTDRANLSRKIKDLGLKRN